MTAACTEPATDNALDDLRRALLRNMMALSLTLQALLTRGGQDRPGQPLELAAMRLGRALADSTLALARLDALAASAVASSDVRMAQGVPASGDIDIRMAGLTDPAVSAEPQETAQIRQSAGGATDTALGRPGDSDIRMKPASRRRGGQPGNRNRRTHGLRTRDARAERARHRALIAEAKRLKGLASPGLWHGRAA